MMPRMEAAEGKQKMPQYSSVSTIDAQEALDYIPTSNIPYPWLTPEPSDLWTHGKSFTPETNQRNVAAKNMSLNADMFRVFV